MPLADFVVNTYSGYTTDKFFFQASSSTAGNCENCVLVEYTWDMGDESPLIHRKSDTISYQFNNAGSYDVKLTVRNNMGFTNADTINKTITVLQYSNLKPETPSLTYPPQNASQIPTKLTLQWSCSDPDGDVLKYDILYGTVNPPSLKVANLSDSYYDINEDLLEATFYYWQVKADDGKGGVTESPVFTFSTVGEGLNLPPNKPNQPYPANGADNQALGSMLQWTCSDPDNDDLVYDLYLGTSSTLTAPVQTNISNTYYINPAQFFAPNETYYWKVIAHDGSDVTESDTWEFTTSSSNFSCPDVTDSDGTTYKSIKIGTQCWMAENLNKGEFVEVTNQYTYQTNNTTIEKYGYFNNESNCAQYGGLYEWDEMMAYTTPTESQGICPAGWHIPSEQEWNQLVIHLGGVLEAGDQLKEGGSSGFEALMAGQRNGESFENLNLNGYFWTSTQKDETEKLSVKIVHNLSKLVYEFEHKAKGKSIRCIKD